MENAAHIKNGILAVLAAAVSFILEQIGGWDSGLKVLVSMMVADYLTGVIVAAVFKNSGKTDSGALNSRAGFIGIVKKGMIIVLIWIATLLDGAMNTAYIRTTLILFFVGNEGISLLENVGLMGVPYPAFLRNLLDALKEKGNSGDTADNTTKEDN